MSLQFLIPAFLAALPLAISPALAAQPPPATLSNPIMRMIASQPEIDVKSPVVAQAEFDPPQVRPGQRSVYRITFNALEASVRLPDRFPEPDGVKLRLNAQGQILQPATNVLRPFTTFNFDARANKPGQFVVPSFIAAVDGKPVVIPEAVLEASDNPPEPHRSARQLLLESETTNAFVGQSIAVRVLSPSWESNIVQALAQVTLNGDGFLHNKNAGRQTIEPLERGGRRVPTFLHDTSLTPIAAGQFTVSAQGFTAGRHFIGPITIQGNVTLPGGPPQYLLLDSEPLTFNVKPVPTEGKLPGYTGGIGVFEVDTPILSTNRVLAGDPVQLTVAVRSAADLSRVEPPPPARVKDWQVFPANPAGGVPPVDDKPPGIAFTYTLIPTSDEVRATPPIPFSYFDPIKAAYVDLTIPPVPVSVIPNGLPMNLPATFGISDSAETETTPALSDLQSSPGKTAASLMPLQLQKWFVAIQVLPALGFLGLWMWDERRRYRELHPEVVRRQAARRQLRRQRRQIRRAAKNGDAPAYVRSSVAAMQIACAPHYIAEPRALVCGDILTVLNGEKHDGRTGEIVRQFFAASDDARFAISPRDPAPEEILGLKSEMEDILMKLEARL